MKANIDRFEDSFDPAEEDQEFHHQGRIPANELFSSRYDENSPEDDQFFGVYVLRFHDEWAKVKIRKLLEFQQSGRVLESRTKAYSYQISYRHNYKGADVIRIIRFDNEDKDWIGHATPHHFHCHTESDTAARDIRPDALHVGNVFPHASDVLSIARHLVWNGVKTIHEPLLAKFKRFTAAQRLEIGQWLPQVIDLLPPLSVLSPIHAQDVANASNVTVIEGAPAKRVE